MSDRSGSWRVNWARAAAEDLARLDQPTAQRIRRAVYRYAETHRGDVKKLRGVDNEWRLRVGEWRVRFAFDAAQRAIIVLRVRSRKDAYRE